MAKHNAMKKINVRQDYINNTVEDIENEESITEDKNVIEEIEEVVEKEPKKFANDEGVSCRSITPGGLYMSGVKSHIMYEWADNGDVTEVEYQDLVAAVRSNSNYIVKPYFIIEDDDFLAQFPQLDKIYSSMYSIKDLRDVLTDLAPNTMKKTILSLPDGAKESIKSLASQMISNGTLDSVQKIKILDEIFDTRLMLMTELFN